jgi:acetoin utilization deacetylase AcuC-like enzyme
MLGFQLVYHARYDLNLGDHVFPARKYRLIHDRLIAERFAEPADFVEPQPASDDDVLGVHDPGWVHRLKTGTLSGAEIVKLEIPYSREMVDGFWLPLAGLVWRPATLCAIASDSTSAEDFITRFRHMEKVFARFTMSPLPSDRYKTNA